MVAATGKHDNGGKSREEILHSRSWRQEPEGGTLWLQQSLSSEETRPAWAQSNLRYTQGDYEIETEVTI